MGLRQQVPGEILEVLAEKVVYAAQQLLQSTAELKRRAFLASGGQRLNLGDAPLDSKTAADERPEDLKTEMETTLPVGVSCSHTPSSVWCPCVFATRRMDHLKGFSTCLFHFLCRSLEH